MHRRRLDFAPPVLASACLGLLLLAPAVALGQAPPPGSADDPSCTTTWTVTTKCTGAAAPLAVPPTQQPMQAPPVYAPPPTYPPVYIPPPAYAPPPAYLPTAPPPRPFHMEQRRRAGLMVTGAALFGGAYLWNAFYAYVGGEGKLAVPVAGPLLLLQGGDQNRFANAALVFDALIQTTGVVLFVVGAATKHEVKVYDDLPRVSIVPTASPSGAGLAAVGRF